MARRAPSCPPAGYDDLIRQIHDGHSHFSKANRELSRFLTQYPNEVAVKSINEIARRCEVHPSTLVRFAQGLGFTGFKDFQAVFRNRLMTAAPDFEARAERLRGEIADKGATGFRRHLRDTIVRDMSALEELFENVEEDKLTKAVEILSKAETIFLMGQLRSEAVVNLLRYALTMIGQRCVLLDASGGLATEIAKTMGPGDALLVVSFQFYAAEVIDTAADARARGVPVLAITDSTLSPVAAADVLFTVPEHEFAFSRSLAAPICLAQTLVLCLAERQGKGELNPRIPVATNKQG